ncbi:MAG: hypothetical protein A3I66_06630 [Burkholderiales bacterium RIFCSPLOWO2_02_FULL_57_36]|nr:MAG: hypothetical protein A3I66_06630 [Burkholderiales bacterium RIFCSPLOWO2_02_FULL_57_36]
MYGVTNPQWAAKRRNHRPSEATEEAPSAHESSGLATRLHIARRRQEKWFSQCREMATIRTIFWSSGKSLAIGDSMREDNTFALIAPKFPDHVADYNFPVNSRTLPQWQ